jgi:hypothetical protein
MCYYLNMSQCLRILDLKDSNIELVQVNVLVVGGGGREHALAWKLSQSPLCKTLYCAPGNPGIFMEANISGTPDLNVNDHEAVVSFCHHKGIGLVVVGPEQPLVEGLVDALKYENICTFGPSKNAAQLEGSKVFMKVSAFAKDQYGGSVCDRMLNGASVLCCATDPRLPLYVVVS